MSIFTWSGIFFLVAMFIFGIIISRKVKDTDDYFIGGRKIHPVLIVSTLSASEIGGGAMLAAVGLGYSSGLGALWYVGPFGIGAIAFALLFSRKLKEAGDKFKYQSMFDWLAGRFGNSDIIRIIGGIAMVAGLFAAMSSQYVAIGTAFESITGINALTGIIIGGICITIYSSLGGLLAVVWTDLFQGIIIIIGMVVVLPILFFHAGGFKGIQSNTPTEYWTFFPSSIEWHLVTLVTMFAAPFVRQYYYQRTFAAKTPNQAKNSMLIQGFVLIVATIWSAFMGMSIYTLNPNLSNPEFAMPWALQEAMPLLLGVFMVGAIIAAIMSTADTLLNAASLTFVRDILSPLRKATIDNPLKVARISSLSIGALSLIIAVFSTSIIDAIMNAWGILGGGLLVPMLISYYWKWTTKEGVISSMIVGLVTTLFLTIVNTPIPAIFGGIVLSFLALVTVSFFTSNNRKLGGRTNVS